MAWPPARLVSKRSATLRGRLIKKASPSPFRQKFLCPENQAGNTRRTVEWTSATPLTPLT